MFCTQFNMTKESVLDMSYDMFVMMLSTTPIPDIDTEDNNDNKGTDGKGPITGTTTMMGYFNR